MAFPIQFTPPMNCESNRSNAKGRRQNWIIDERKCLSFSEVETLRKQSGKLLCHGLKSSNYSLVWKWYMVELGLGAGLRVSEMCSLSVGDALCDDSKSSLIVHGKGNKIRAVWMSSEFKNTTKTYIGCLKRFCHAVGPESPMFPSPRGKALTKRALQKAFKIMIYEAGLPARYSNHSMRHTYATFLLRASNNDYRFVQRQLGHASISTTQVYASVLESEGRKALEKLYG